MITTAKTSAPVTSLAVKGALYRWLAGAWAYPTAAWQHACTDGAWAAALAEAAAGLGDEALLAATTHLGHLWAAENMRTCGLAEEYTFLFARQVQVPLYEHRYLPSGDFGQSQGLAEVSGIYAAFGFQVEGELPDHLGAELEFLGVLCLKEAYAYEQGLVEQADICHQARGRFLAEHPGRWLPAFANRLREKARLPFYPALADVATALVRLDCAALGVVAEGTDAAWMRPGAMEDDGKCAL